MINSKMPRTHTISIPSKRLKILVVTMENKRVVKRNSPQKTSKNPLMVFLYSFDWPQTTESRDLLEGGVIRTEI